MKRFVSKYRIPFLLLTVVLVIAYYFSLPDQLFQDPYSTILLSSDKELLSANISDDGQWRFPQTGPVNEKFAKAITAFEDKRFYEHHGVDWLSLARAFRQNIAAGKIVSGGSTLSMQVIRLSRKNRSRSFFEKAVEIILATRLELRYSKEEILMLHAAHAPFGGNVVGLEAASWRYFGREPESLSWGEAALLAVLPNAPALIHPGKNRFKLKAKRDRLLEKLKQTGVIDDFTCDLSKKEPIPAAPHALPMHGRHLLTTAEKDGLKGQRILSTIDLGLQTRCAQILADHHRRLKGNQIFNGAILVLDVQSGEALAYIGNTNVSEDRDHGDEVDVIQSPRSTGSILKPFLYAGMLDEGLILPKTILPDVPTIINGFAPQNFSKEYDGAVPADKALIRSLNIPAIHMLREFRYERFHSLLRNLGMTTLVKQPDHYGLSLVLGGAEGTLWEVTGMYASMARTLNNFYSYPGNRHYAKTDFHPPYYRAHPTRNATLEENSWISSSAIYLTFEALKEVYRPGEETGWRYFNNARNIAWKTGTSFGFRDGWAVGVTPDYAVGIWVGNADGEGRPGLTGTDAAAPLLFDVFHQLPGNSWFDRPESEMAKIITCRKSGFRWDEKCEVGDTAWIAKAGLKTRACSNHRIIHLTKNSAYQLHSDCASLSEMKHEKWFVLPPIQEYYFKAKNSSFKVLPPFRMDCMNNSLLIGMDLIYPKSDSRIFLPRDIDGHIQNTVFELAHRNPNASVFWHLDGQYIGSTKKIHHIVLQPKVGKHTLTVVDEGGESIERQFEVISKM